MRALSLTALALVGATLVSCGKEEPVPTTKSADAPAKPSGAIPMPSTKAAPAAAHSHDAQHGGTMVELGEHEGHLEIVLDAATGTLTAYVYDADMKPVATEAPVINLTTGVQLPMTPLAGTAPMNDAWKASNEALKAKPDGRVRLRIGERTYQAKLEAKPEPK